MRVLITGSSGLVGRRLGTLLRSRGVEFSPFDLTADGSDICDPRRIAAAIAGCEGVVHLAAVSRVAWGEQDAGLCHRVNVIGTEQVLRAALSSHQQPWIVFASSREVYGDPDEMPVTEAAAIRPLNNYGRSKASGESLMAVAAAAGLRTAVLRLSNVYGVENDHPDRAVPSLMWRALQGEDLRLSGLEGFFDFVHVSDTAKGIVMAIEQLAAGVKTVPTVHLATGVATTLGALAEMAIRVTQSTSKVVVLPSRSFDVKGFCGCPDAAERVLGWRAEATLEAGLHEFLEILRQRCRALDPVEMPLSFPVMS